MVECQTTAQSRLCFPVFYFFNMICKTAYASFFFFLFCSECFSIRVWSAEKASLTRHSRCQRGSGLIQFKHMWRFVVIFMSKSEVRCSFKLSAVSRLMVWSHRPKFAQTTLTSPGFCFVLFLCGEKYIQFWSICVFLALGRGRCSVPCSVGWNDGIVQSS